MSVKKNSAEQPSVAVDGAPDGHAEPLAAVPSADSGTCVYFYDATKENGALSNFYQPHNPIFYKGKAYKTSEHLYQALKYLYPGCSLKSAQYADEIRRAKTPNMAKILARRQIGSGYPWRIALNRPIQDAIDSGVEQRADWHDVKLDIMLRVLRVKFGQDEKSASTLLATGTRALVEHTSRDTYWADGGDGSGANHLGRLLQAVRSELCASGDRSSPAAAGKRRAITDWLLPRKVKRVSSKSAAGDSPARALTPKPNPTSDEHN